MKENRFRAELGISLLHGAIELLLYFPVLLAVQAFLVPEQPLWLWAGTLPLTYAVGYALNRKFTFRRLYSLLGIVIFLGAIAAFLCFPSSYHFIWMLPLASLNLYRGAKVVAIPWRTYFSVSYFYIGLVSYFILSVLLPFIPALVPYQSALLWSGLLALGVTLWTTNQSNMQQETLSGDKEPSIASPVLWNNRLMVGMLFVIIIVVVLFRKLQQALYWLKEQLLYWIAWLLNRPSPTQEIAPPAAVQPPPLGLPAPGEPSPWLVWLEKIGYVVVGVLLVLGVVFLFFKLSRKLWEGIKLALRRLTAWLNREGKARQEAAYEDDVESLMNWQGWNVALSERWKRWRDARLERHIKWEELKDNREKIRYLYRSLLQKAIRDGYTYKPHLTPKEAVRDMEAWKSRSATSTDGAPLITMYEQVRYGDKHVDDAEVWKVKKEIERK